MLTVFRLISASGRVLTAAKFTLLSILTIITIRLKNFCDWDFVLNKFKENEKYDLNDTYIFHGIGDRGGAPEEKSVAFVEQEIKKTTIAILRLLPHLPMKFITILKINIRLSKNQSFLFGKTNLL